MGPVLCLTACYAMAVLSCTSKAKGHLLLLPPELETRPNKSCVVFRMQGTDARGLTYNRAQVVKGDRLPRACADAHA
jgi:hypothetical protein